MSDSTTHHAPAGRGIWRMAQPIAQPAGIGDAAPDALADAVDNSGGTEPEAAEPQGKAMDGPPENKAVRFAPAVKARTR